MRVRVYVGPFRFELFGNVVSARIIDGGWSIAHRDGRGQLLEKTYGVGEWSGISFDMQAVAAPDVHPADAKVIG